MKLVKDTDNNENLKKISDEEAEEALNEIISENEKTRFRS